MGHSGSDERAQQSACRCTETGSGQGRKDPTGRSNLAEAGDRQQTQTDLQTQSTADYGSGCGSGSRAAGSGIRRIVGDRSIRIPVILPVGVVRDETDVVARDAELLQILHGTLCLGEIVE
jgi:hypothetical protein